MTKIKNRLVVAATSIFLVMSGQEGIANATEQPSVDEVVKEAEVQQRASQTSLVPAFSRDATTATRSASGWTPAPGGNGAYVGLNVNGNGLYVKNAYVNYFPGTDLAGSNPSAEAFELAWYEGRQRRVEIKGPDSGIVRATQSWAFHRRIDAGPMCGRVKVSGKWSNYSCVEIKP